MHTMSLSSLRCFECLRDKAWQHNGFAFVSLWSSLTHQHRWLSRFLFNYDARYSCIICCCKIYISLSKALWPSRRSISSQVHNSVCNAAVTFKLCDALHAPCSPSPWDWQHVPCGSDSLLTHRSSRTSASLMLRWQARDLPSHTRTPKRACGESSRAILHWCSPHFNNPI